MDRELQRKVVRGLAVVAAIIAILLMLKVVESGRASSRAANVSVAREPIAAVPKPAPAEPPAPAATTTPRAAAAPAATQIPATPEASPAPEETLTVEQSAIGPLWVAGTVRDEAGKAVEVADVALERSIMKAPALFAGAGLPALTNVESLAAAKTNAEGYYEFPLPADPSLRVSVESPGYGRTSINLYPAGMRPTTAPDGRRIIRCDFSLDKSMKFAGRVVDEEKAPVADATVRIRGGAQTTTNAAGQFSFTISPKTQMAFLQLGKAGHTSVEYGIEDRTTEKDWLLARLGGRIAGRLLDTDGTPMPGHAVTAYGSRPANFGNPDPVAVETTTDAQGAFVFQPMAAGAWRLIAQDAKPGRFGLQKSAHQEVPLGELESVEGVELRMPAPLAVGGIVVSGEKEEPVEGAQIGLGNGDKDPFPPVLTGADGRFELTDLFATREQWWGIRRRIVVTREGYRPGKLEEGDTGAWMQDKALPIEEKAILMAENIVTVSGHVVDYKGTPVRDVVVASKDFAEERALTDAQGRFTVKALQDHPAHLSAFPADTPKTYHPAIDVKDTPITGIEIVLDRGAAVELEVLNPEGKPVQGAMVWVSRRTYAASYSSISEGKSGTTDARGRALIEGLPSSGATLDPDLQRASVDAQATHPDYADGEVRDIKLTPEATAHQELRLVAKGAATLEGFVRDEAGEPIEGVTVQAQGGTSIELSKTDALGFFRVEKLVPGKYLLLVEHPKYRYAIEHPEAPASDLVITLMKK